MKTVIELKPCPFCGDAPERQISNDVLRIQCPRCVSVGFSNHVRFGCVADEQWNKRAETRRRGNTLRLLQYLHKASFSSEVDKLEAKQCAEELQSRADLADRFAERLTALVDKLDTIAADESYKAQCSMAYIHGHRYEGPNWAAELISARDLLAEYNKRGEQ